MVRNIRPGAGVLRSIAAIGVVVQACQSVVDNSSPQQENLLTGSRTIVINVPELSRMIKSQKYSRRGEVHLRAWDMCSVTAFSTSSLD